MAAGGDGEVRIVGSRDRAMGANQSSVVRIGPGLLLCCELFERASGIRMCAGMPADNQRTNWDGYRVAVGWRIAEGRVL